MALYGKYPDRQFVPCPEGHHQAVLVDAVDMGICETSYGSRPQLRLVWQIATLNPATGRRHDVRRIFTNSMFKSANLRQTLEAWRGVPFTEPEAKHFDVESLLGVNAMLEVVHRTSERTGDVFANVIAVRPVPPGLPPLVPLQYTRAQDRSDRRAIPPRPAPDHHAPPCRCRISTRRCPRPRAGIRSPHLWTTWTTSHSDDHDAA